ncbi:hypothetical protein R6Q57_021680 [Mikania cordata]
MFAFAFSLEFVLVLWLMRFHAMLCRSDYAPKFEDKQFEMLCYFNLYGLMNQVITWKRANTRVPRSSSRVPVRGTNSYQSHTIRDPDRDEASFLIQAIFVKWEPESRTRRSQIAFPTNEFVEFGPESLIEASRSTDASLGFPIPTVSVPDSFPS